MNRKRLLASAVGALVAAAIAGGVAYATIPGPDNVYSACMLKGVGTIRLIDKSLPASNLMSHCTDKETEISWNQAGQPGPAGPQGAKGEPGAPGTNGTNGTNGKDGVNVTSEPEPAGANCAAGGSKFSSANGVTYACNGAKGDPGQSGPGGGGLTGRELVTVEATGACDGHNSFGFCNHYSSAVAIARCPAGKVATGGAGSGFSGPTVDGWTSIANGGPIDAGNPPPLPRASVTAVCFDAG